MINVSIKQGDLTHVSNYPPNIRTPKYIKQILTSIKEEIDSNTIIIEYFNTSHQWIDHLDRKSIRKYWPYMTY